MDDGQRKLCESKIEDKNTDTYLLQRTSKIKPIYRVECIAADLNNVLNK